MTPASCGLRGEFSRAGRVAVATYAAILPRKRQGMLPGGVLHAVGH